MSGQDIDPLVAASDPAMVIVTTTAEGAPAGCLVGFHSQSSMAGPPVAGVARRAVRHRPDVVRSRYSTERPR